MTQTREELGPGRKTVLLYALIGGLCPLSPVPFIDDLIIGALRRRMVRSLLRRAELQPADYHVHLLAQDPRGDRLEGCVLGLLRYVVKRVLRKVLYFLAVKDCVDEATAMIQVGWLVWHDIDRGGLDQALLDQGRDGVLAHRGAIWRTRSKVDDSPLTRLLGELFRSSKGAIKEAAGALGGVLRARKADRTDPEAIDRAVDDLAARDDGPLKGLMDRLLYAVGANRAYFADLEAEFERQLQETPES